jgi:hypothetical protein
VDKKNTTVSCPECGAQITVDLATGTLLHHRPAKTTREPGKDFDALLAGLDASKEHAEDVFQREVSALDDRDRLMEEKFREALRRAEEEPDEGKPIRPWDLD